MIKATQHFEEHLNSAYDALNIPGEHRQYETDKSLLMPTARGPRNFYERTLLDWQTRNSDLECNFRLGILSIRYRLFGDLNSSNLLEIGEFIENGLAKCYRFLFQIDCTRVSHISPAAALIIKSIHSTAFYSTIYMTNVSPELMLQIRRLGLADCVVIICESKIGNHS